MMTTQIAIKVEGRRMPFTLEWRDQKWHSLEKLKESDFPLAAVVNGIRYEFYSDETFAEVER